MHGPVGVLDLVVPAGATSADVAREYAAQAGLAAIPLLHTQTGLPLRADVALVEAGVEPGDLLVATTSVHRPRAPGRTPLVARSSAAAGALSRVWFSLAAGMAVLAGWAAAVAGPGTQRDATVVLLLLAAALGAVPLGTYAVHRALTAPAFGAAAGLALAWDPHPESLPLVVGVAGLAAAVTAAVARSLAGPVPGVEEGLRVWLVAGATLFAAAGLAAVLGLPAAATWSLVLVGAMLSARYVPSLAVDVPDQLLIDLERLAVTAWSAREQPRGRRGRAVASPRAIEAVAARGAAIITAAGAAVAVVSVLAAHLLLEAADRGVGRDVDLLGARLLVLLAGAALLLAARSHRHTAARRLLRVAGLGCWAVLLAAYPDLPVALAGTAIALAVVLVVAAVATGRGWRSVWWSRRAEVAEGLTGAGALAVVLVSSGLFRTVWELGSRVAP